MVSSNLKVINAQTKLKLKIPQLTLGDLAQMDRHWNENTRFLFSYKYFKIVKYLAQTTIIKPKSQTFDTIEFDETILSKERKGDYRYGVIKII